MEEAAGQQQQQQTQHAPAADYNSYAAHGSAAAYPSNPTLSGQTGGYGSYFGY